MSDPIKVKRGARSIRVATPREFMVEEFINWGSPFGRSYDWIDFPVPDAPAGRRWATWRWNKLQQKTEWLEFVLVD